MTGRWKDDQGNNLYDTFIPEMERPAIAQNADVPAPQSGEKRKRQPRRPTAKGALFYKYSRDYLCSSAPTGRLGFLDFQSSSLGRAGY